MERILLGSGDLRYRGDDPARLREPTGGSVLPATGRGTSGAFSTTLSPELIDAINAIHTEITKPAQ
jgi:hypothetical protein